MPTYTFHCSNCGGDNDYLCRIAERPEHIKCPACGDVAFRTMQAPMVMKESYPDGTKRKGFAEMKEAAKLHTEAATARKDRKKEIAGEIRKLGVRMSKDPA